MKLKYIVSRIWQHWASFPVAVPAPAALLGPVSEVGLDAALEQRHRGRPHVVAGVEPGRIFSFFTIQLKFHQVTFSHHITHSNAAKSSLFAHEDKRRRLQDASGSISHENKPKTKSQKHIGEGKNWREVIALIIEHFCDQI